MSKIKDQKSKIIEKMLQTIKKWKWLLVIVLLSTVGAGGYFYFQKIQPNRKVLNKIVIFPFTNLKGDSATDYLSLEFRDELIKTLNLSDKYEIIKGSSLKPDDDTGKILAEYHAKNDVNLAVLGSYSTEPDEIEITAKLVNTVTNKTLFTKNLTLPTKNISFVPPATAVWIIQELGLFVVEIRNNENIDKQAAEDFKKATDFRNKNNIVEAVKYAEKALERQPDFYGCRSLLADTFRKMATEKSADSSIDYYEKSAEQARLAMQLNSDDSRAGIMLATIYADEGDLEASLREYKRLRQTIFDSVGKLRFGLYLARFGGLLEESDKLAQESFKYAPKTKYRQPQIYYRGDYEGFRDAVTLESPEPNWNSFYLGLMGLYLKNPEAARQNFNASLVYEGTDLLGDLSRAYLLHLDGKDAEGLRLLKYWSDKAAVSKHFSGEMLYYLATAYSFLGDNDGTLRIFKRAVENGFYCYPLFVRDPILDKLRDNQEFQDTLELARQKHIKFKELYYSELSPEIR